MCLKLSNCLFWVCESCPGKCNDNLDSYISFVFVTLTIIDFRVINRGYISKG